MLELFLQYQLLMAEAILTLYSSNCWSFFHTPRTKRNMHWVIQVIGSTFAIVGTAILIPERSTHFQSAHSITGLVSLILTIIALINGIMALWPLEFYMKFQIRPIVLQIAHNSIGVASFVFGKHLFLQILQRSLNFIYLFNFIGI